MPRSCLLDHLQANRFWLMDTGPIEPTVGPVLSPAYGFASITAPSLNLDMEEIGEGTGLTTHVVKGGGPENITLTRGASVGDSDFYAWVTAARTGRTGSRSLRGARVGGVGVTPRRTLVLVHFFSHFPGDGPLAQALGVAALGGLASYAAASSGFGRVGLASGGGVAAVGGGGGVAASLGLQVNTGTISTFAIPARAWVLKGCIPVSYKAGSDFEGSNAEVSMMELELAVHDFEEVTL